jgi:hypothetical protein
VSGSTTLLWHIDQASVRLECRQLSGIGLCQTSVSTGSSGPVHAWTAHLMGIGPQAVQALEPSSFLCTTGAKPPIRSMYGRNSFLARSHA